MKLMRGDMGGAAAVCSAAWAIATLQLPVNLVVLAPLTENMPGPSASKPGDMFVSFLSVYLRLAVDDVIIQCSVYAMNGKSIEIDNTDAEGRLVLAGTYPFLRYYSLQLNVNPSSDALWYGSTEFKATKIIDVATLTGAMDIALGEVFTGVFTVRFVQFL